MDSSERLHLRSSDFESNIKRGLFELRKDEDFFDVTLACGSKQMKAHKVILSACSPFFRSLIKSVPHQHPLLYLRGIKAHHLESLLCFMYNGEVSVDLKDLDELLAVAKELQVTGLIKSAGPSGEEDVRINHVPTEVVGIPGTSSMGGTPAALHDDEVNEEYVTIKEESELLTPDNVEEVDLEDESMDNFFECPSDMLSHPDDSVLDQLNQGSSGVSGNTIQDVSPIGDDVRLIKSIRGRDVVVDPRGYVYNRNSESKYKILWACRNRDPKCTARIHTNLIGDKIKILKYIRSHTHEPRAVSSYMNK